MNLSDAFFYSNEQLLLENLLPIDQQHFNQINKEYWDGKHRTVEFKEWQEIVTHFGYDVNRIKRNSNTKSLRQYFYEGDYMTTEINTLDPSWLSNEFTIGCLEADDYGKKLFEGKNYTLYFFSEQNLFAIDYFHRHYKKIAKEDRYVAFKNMYLYCDYGFELFNKDMLSDILKLADNKKALEILTNKGIVNNGYITIYRGMGERSTPLEDAYSWTLSLETAKRFAHHFSPGVVYEGKVKLEKILDYLPDRKEEEVWVEYDEIENVIETQE